MRPASVLAAAIAPFESKVTLGAFGNNVNAKSLISVMACCINCGDEIEIFAEGADEDEALACAVEIIQHGLSRY